MMIEGSAANLRLIESAHRRKSRQRQNGDLYFLIPVDSVGDDSQCHKSVSDVASKILQSPDLSNDL